MVFMLGMVTKFSTQQNTIIFTTPVDKASNDHNHFHSFELDISAVMLKPLQKIILPSADVLKSSSYPNEHKDDEVFFLKSGMLPFPRSNVL